MKKLACWLLGITLLVSAAAHEIADQGAEAPGSWLDPLISLKIGVAVVLFCSAVSFLQKERSERMKKILFGCIVAAVLLPTLYLAGHTIAKNVQSVTNGPVHWHADYKVVGCGAELDLINPTFPKNKIGTPVLHEHDDNRIHLEGTVRELEEASLHTYFRVIGGILEEGHLAYPSTEGFREWRDGDSCPGEDPGTLKVYVNGKRVEHGAEYIIYPDAYVPPGDCVILLFDSSDAPTTELLCESWDVKGWKYDSFQREEVTIGGHTWQ